MNKYKMTMIAALTLLGCLFGSDRALDGVEVTTIAEGLNVPCGVAIQPETGHVFVADSGAGRVIRIVDGKIEVVITGFPVDKYGKGPTYPIGPLGLTFIDRDVLAVGGGGLPDAKDLLRIYNLPKVGAEALQADNMATSFSIDATDKLAGEGNFYGLAFNGNAIFATCNGDDTKGWIARAGVKGAKVGSFSRAIATKELTDVDAPVAITIAPDGSLAVGQMGEISLPGDGLLTFYDAATGDKLANFETGLNDITGLAYGPRGQLLATDYSWSSPQDGGLFRIVAKYNKKKQGIEVEKVISLDKPTAIDIDSKGDIYVTIIGSGEGASGKLLKIIK
ncbi:MAG: ScyD/ScyE family protein [Planctomycetaceae bacterium]|jgi:DNA-binding beta-propeller fold protein YncE|nr:ScyD/ScyE family protein [Planctomycetaceae bacterium]MBT4725054.1 ScyD/ScyE family protein [Planctomycetaceae bacterium]MBT4845173.1 ScyD/ScyE family protein [Planctomycetaceae bacterium]MBT5126478.1 ScyD/ScyE family protein [Planctomycetaceae bacterium]MBT5599551.1 ScyD/ScyE family protein [Planctomycetaceae bacterium]